MLDNVSTQQNKMTEILLSLNILVWILAPWLHQAPLCDVSIRSNMP